MDKYVALEPVNYDALQLNRATVARDTTTDKSPQSLMLLCCAAICRQGAVAAKEAVLNMPCHLASTLLREGVVSMRSAAISSIVSNWPLPVLCFREVLPDPVHRDVFEEDMGTNIMLFKGITGITRKSRMRTLDLRGFSLNWNFTKLIVEMWPLLSMRRNQRNIKKLTNLILRTAGLKKDNRLAKEIIPKLLEDLMNHDMAQHPDFFIDMPRGDKLIVKIDRVEFSTQNTFFMEYLLTNCLRSVTPVVIEPANIIIKSDLNIGDEILDSLAPFIAFRGQDSGSLDGVWIENLEDNVFFITCQDLQCFTNVTGLGFPNCNIMLQAGRTRQRTSTRHQFTNMLKHFNYLTRLDLSQNSFAGCLKEVLDALVVPLEYLSLKECDLCDEDIEDLASSKHSKSLRQLELSRICGLFPEDNFAVSTTTLLRNLKHFTSISVIHLQQNQITDTKIDDLCHIITTYWPKLNSLNLSENVLSVDSVLKVARNCCRTKIQHLCVPYSHNFLENFNVFENARLDFVSKVKDVLKGCGREDIDVKVCGLAYAVFGNL